MRTTLPYLASTAQVLHNVLFLAMVSNLNHEGGRKILAQFILIEKDIEADMRRLILLSAKLRNCVSSAALEYGYPPTFADFPVTPGKAASNRLADRRG